MRRVITLIAGAVLPLLLGGCIPPFGSSDRTGPLEIPIEQTSLTLGWDYSPGRVTQSGSTVESFRLYYRDRKSANWTSVATIEAREDPVFMISADAVLGDNQTRKLEFGVSTLTADGTESRIHASTDFEARPHGGWYVHWSRP